MCDGGCECGDAGVSPTRRESAYDMVRVEDAVRRVLAAATPLEAQQVAARTAKGLVLAAAVRSSVRQGKQRYACLETVLCGLMCHCGFLGGAGAVAAVPRVDHGRVRGGGSRWRRNGASRSGLATLIYEEHGSSQCCL